MNQSNAILLLNDGSYYLGTSIGSRGETKGEMCFNTAMTGYQEVFSDPSYYGQMVVMTFPHIGNVGINLEDHESSRPFLRGLIIDNGITPPSNHRSEKHLDIWLKKSGIVGISHINTRSLVKKIRDASSPLRGLIGPYAENKKEEILNHLQLQLQDETGLSGHDTSLFVQNQAISGFSSSASSRRKIVVLDFGLKKSILHALQSNDYEIIVLPGDYSLDQILFHQPVGVVLSNGPGDPRSTLKEKKEMINKIIEWRIPLLGICLGFQLIGLALGGTIAQLPCGHHGINHPVYDSVSQKTWITSQNHEYHLLMDSLPESIKPTFISLFDHSLEGFLVKNKPVIAVQFHPEGNPGPQDCAFLFTNFLTMVNQYAQKN